MITATPSIKKIAEIYGLSSNLFSTPIYLRSILKKKTKHLPSGPTLSKIRRTWSFNVVQRFALRGRQGNVQRFITHVLSHRSAH